MTLSYFQLVTDGSNNALTTDPNKGSIRRKVKSSDFDSGSVTKVTAEINQSHPDSPKDGKVCVMDSLTTITQTSHNNSPLSFDSTIGIAGCFIGQSTIG